MPSPATRAKFAPQEAVTRFAAILANRFLAFAAPIPWSDTSPHLNKALAEFSSTSPTGTCTYTVDGQNFTANLTQTECDALGGTFG